MLAAQTILASAAARGHKSSIDDILDASRYAFTMTDKKLEIPPPSKVPPMVDFVFDEVNWNRIKAATFGDSYGDDPK